MDKATGICCNCCNRHANSRAAECKTCTMKPTTPLSRPLPRRQDEQMNSLHPYQRHPKYHWRPRPRQSHRQPEGRSSWRILRQLESSSFLVRVSLLTAFLLWGGATGATASDVHTEDVVLDTSIVKFSPEWMQKYDADDVGCAMGRGSYTWRPYGFGSNMNNMLNAWVYALAVEGWSDLALLSDPSEFGAVECHGESGGEADRGWRCLFSEMPHLCQFDSSEAWTESMEARGASDSDREEAMGLTLDKVRFALEEIDSSLVGTDVDQFGALAVMATYLWSHMTPWLKRNIHYVTHVGGHLSEVPFVGIHVRRGDKVTEGEAQRWEVDEYLEAAVNYLAEDSSRTPIDDIKGIWVASDDSSVVGEVRKLARTYFPNVSSENILFVSDGVPGGPKRGALATHVNREHYGAFVYMFADFQQLAKADVFVGTFSSNVGRLVAVLREGNAKPMDSSISLDTQGWWPGRRY